MTARPGLLVSVRSADEARIALAGGADVIDVKEPSRGSLGAADGDVVAAVVSTVGGRVPVSVAGGELLDAADLPIVDGVAFAKIGLAGCGSLADWPMRWRAAIARWPSTVKPVAVVYADWHRADAPSPSHVLAQAVAAGCPALLVDTWDKSLGSLFDHWSAQEVARFSGRVREAGMAIVLAGSLQGEGIRVAVACGPQLIAVRGAVCAGGRSGSISVSQMQAVRAALDAEISVVGDSRMSLSARAVS